MKKLTILSTLPLISILSGCALLYPNIPDKEFSNAELTNATRLTAFEKSHLVSGVKTYMVELYLGYNMPNAQQSMFGGIPFDTKTTPKEQYASKMFELSEPTAKYFVSLEGNQHYVIFQSGSSIGKVTQVSRGYYETTGYNFVNLMGASYFDELFDFVSDYGTISTGIVKSLQFYFENETNPGNVSFTRYDDEFWYQNLILSSGSLGTFHVGIEDPVVYTRTVQIDGEDKTTTKTIQYIDMSYEKHFLTYDCFHITLDSDNLEMLKDSEGLSCEKYTYNVSEAEAFPNGIA